MQYFLLFSMKLGKIHVIFREITFFSMKKIPAIFLAIIIVSFIGIVIYQGAFVTHLYTLPKNESIQTSAQRSVLGSQSTDIQHIVIITMENKSYEDIVGNDDAPYINALLHRYSFANNYVAVSHPSLPNYLALIGGSTYGITSDCTNCTVAASNLVDQLESIHKSWKAYMESMPSNCFIGSSEDYAQKHDPFIYFDDIRSNPNRCNNIVPMTQLESDLAVTTTTPNFIWISPNLCNDMHNCSVATGDTWLSQEVTRILSSPAFTTQRSLLVITWDEGEGGGGNQVPIILAGNAAKKTYVSHIAYSHYSLLHTIEKIWHVSSLTQNVARSHDMSDILSK